MRGRFSEVTDEGTQVRHRRTQSPPLTAAAATAAASSTQVKCTQTVSRPSQGLKGLLCHKKRHQFSTRQLERGDLAYRTGEVVTMLHPVILQGQALLVTQVVDVPLDGLGRHLDFTGERLAVWVLARGDDADEATHPPFRHATGSHADWTAGF